MIPCLIIGKNSTIPLVSKLADASSVLDEKAMISLGKDIEAAHVYDFVSACKYQNKEKQNEFTRQIIII